MIGNQSTEKIFLSRCPPFWDALYLSICKVFQLQLFTNNQFRISFSLILSFHHNAFPSISPNFPLHRSSLLDERSMWCSVRSRNQRISILLPMASREDRGWEFSVGNGEKQQHGHLEGLHTRYTKRRHI